MAWHITGTDLGPCSCDLGCPCILGATEGDRGWCSAVRLYHIRSGEIDGVDVSGSKVALVADWPSGFLAGNGTGTGSTSIQASLRSRGRLWKPYSPDSEAEYLRS